MITIYDNETNEVCGTITEQQLQFLIAQMEEESDQDKDYYINQDTIGYFESLGADPELLALLRGILGERDEMEIRWSSQ